MVEFVGVFHADPPVKVQIKDTPFIRRFFNGTEGYTQRTNVTLGETYEVYTIEGCGDVGFACFLGDNGQETELPLDWLQEVKDTEVQLCQN